MKRTILLVALLMALVMLLSACTEQPENTDATEGTTTIPTQGTSESPGVENVQESKHIATAANAEYLPDEDARKAIADYKAGYTPYTSKMANGVLTGVSEIAFETDYDIAKTTVYRVGRVDENNADAELRGYSGGKPKAKWDGRKVTVDIGWWHESDGWTKSYPVWSYIVCVKDTAGTFHNYYFRVEYATTDTVGLNTEKDYEAFINNNEWYRRALGCAFEKPEDIAAYYYFYTGVGETSQQFTEEERTFLKDAYQKKNPNGYYEAMSDVKLPVAKINDALSILGVTIADIKIPDQWVYYDKTDSYYFWVSDAYGVGRWSVTKVEKGIEGIVAVYWKMDGIDNGEPSVEIPSRGAKMVMTMQLQSDGTYRVLSNVPQK